MRRRYLCPRCKQSFYRLWFLRGGCPDCGVSLVDWLPPLLYERVARGEHVRPDSLHDGPTLGDGVRVWSSELRHAIHRSTLWDFFIELPSGEVFLLERREQMVQAGVRIESGVEALRYVRFLHGYGGLSHHGALADARMYELPLRQFTEQQPRYIELFPGLSVGSGRYEIKGLAGVVPPPSVQNADESRERRFRVVRYALTAECLPTEVGKSLPLASILRIEETVCADGRYQCEAVEAPPLPSAGYRQDEDSRAFDGVSITLNGHLYERGRPLRAGERSLVARLWRSRGWH